MKSSLILNKLKRASEPCQNGDTVAGLASDCCQAVAAKICSSGCGHEAIEAAASHVLRSTTTFPIHYPLSTCSVALPPKNLTLERLGIYPGLVQPAGYCSLTSRAVAIDPLRATPAALGAPLPIAALYGRAPAIEAATAAKVLSVVVPSTPGVRIITSPELSAAVGSSAVIVKAAPGPEKHSERNLEKATLS